jgi:hypothetical protein
MAVDIKRTFYGWTDTQPLAMSATVATEGQGLVAVLEDNIEKVKPGTGAGGEVFVGFARFRQLQFPISANVENLVIPNAAPYTVELAKTNLVIIPTVQCRAVITSSGAPFIPAGAASPGHFVIDATHGVLTFDIADAGTPITVTYRWNLTVYEAKTTLYEAPVNYPDPNMAGQVGVGKGKSRIYTLHFDATKLYNATSALCLGADGMVTVAGGGAAIPNSRVVQVPTAADPYLAVEFMA